MTSKIIYKGDLRTEATHLKSSNKIITDAPTDNNGKGQAFSPTDLVATALGSCMVTIIGIRAKQHGIELGEITTDIKKIMTSNPRRISEIEVAIYFKNIDYNTKEKEIIIEAAKTCPVALSIHPDIKQSLSFHF